MRRIRVARVGTVPIALIGYGHQFNYLQAHDCDVSVVCSPDAEVEHLKRGANYRVIPLTMAREIEFVQDLKSLWNLYRLFRRERFDIVHSSTPKAGLLTALAAFFARVPIRIHTFTGQRWVTLGFIKKRILIAFDRLIGMLNTHSFADSPSQVDFLIENVGLSSKKLDCLHKGSFAGIDLKRFDFDRIQKERAAILAEVGCPTDLFKIMFLGRIVEDKGVNELIEAFKSLQAKGHKLSLIMVGPFEVENPVSTQTRAEIEKNPHIFHLGLRANPERFLSVADVLCLPSYREGFGTSILEAAAMKVPSIGTDIVGLRDAIDDGKTGLLIRPRDSKGLELAIEKMMSDPGFTSRLGQQSFERVKVDFSSEIISEKLLEAYRKFFNQLKA
jgi:glycosyltransferase involved in cell wall biosynthesis